MNIQRTEIPHYTREQIVEQAPVCETCDGDGYVDIVDDWGGVIGPAPCPNCHEDDPFASVAWLAVPGVGGP